MYRAVIASNLVKRSTISDLTLAVLRRELVQQFVASPMCSEVVVERSDVDSLIPLNTPAHAKLSSITAYSALPKTGARDLIVNVGFGVSPRLDAAQIDHLVLVTSIFSKRQIDTVRQHLSGNPPISVFQTGRVIPTLSLDKGTDISSLRPRRQVVEDAMYPIMSQFLPSRFREIQSKNLAQAIRLNYETCAGEYNAANVEYLDFVDCMKIIGLEDKI